MVCDGLCGFSATIVTSAHLRSDRENAWRVSGPGAGSWNPCLRHRPSGGGSVSRSNTSRPMIWPCSRMNGTSRERTSSTAARRWRLARLVAEAGIEEAGIMDAELAHQRIERHHLGGIVGRDRHRLAADQDVELVRVQHDVARGHWPRSAPSNRPGPARRACRRRSGRCAAWRASRCGLAGSALPFRSMRQRQAVVDIGFAIDQRRLLHAGGAAACR